MLSERSSLWIPLRPIEEEHDLEKAQTLEEMIVILREVSLLSLTCSFPRDNPDASPIRHTYQ